MASDFANEGIHDGNLDEFLKDIDDRGLSRGLRHRNYSAHPSGYLAAVPTFPDELLIPQSDQQRLLDQQKADRSSLWDIREANYSVLKSLDQDGLGLCWAFSSTKAMMYARAIMGEPGVVLSAWYLAGMIKSWRDEGGWGAESMGGAASMGIPAMDLCPSYKRSYATQAVADDAKLHLATNWYDGTDSRDKNFEILKTAALMGWPAVVDYNWLSHSMAFCYLESLDTGYTDNSWNDISQYGPKGTMKVSSNKLKPDGIVVCVTSTPSGH